MKRKRSLPMKSATSPMAIWYHDPDPGVVNTFVIFISRVIAQIAAGFLGGNREDEGESSNGNPLIYFAVATVLELVFGILASIITMWFSRYVSSMLTPGSARLVGREKMIAALQRLKTSYEPQEASSMMAFLH
ncbi:heat shock protein HtpX [Klebsiella pneumoniae]|uniref:Heat shock protein HtpX n=1 Tax=Klebsiella pneumoniae TaxID=573 RepID=A0A2X3HKV2_KLEPN|nr:heat shock protein HtpX [Klebsiella pneumoniae]